MSTQVQLRRGSTAQHESFTSALAEVTVNVDTHALHVHDGSTAGGFAPPHRAQKRIPHCSRTPQFPTR